MLEASIGEAEASGGGAALDKYSFNALYTKTKNYFCKNKPNSRVFRLIDEIVLDSTNGKLD